MALRVLAALRHSECGNRGEFALDLAKIDVAVEHEVEVVADAMT